MVRFFTALAISLLICSHSALGQNEEIVEFDFRVFGVGKDSYEGLFYFSRGEYLPIAFHRTHRSIETYHYRGPKSLQIFVKNPDYNPTRPSTHPYLPIASVNIGDYSNEMLLIFSAAPDNRDVFTTGRRFRIFPLNDDTSYFSSNTIVVLNATGARLTGRVAQTRIDLPVGLSQPIPYQGIGNKEQGNLIAFAVETATGSKLVMSNEVSLSNNRRILLILEPPRRPGSMRISARKLTQSVFLPNTQEKQP